MSEMENAHINQVHTYIIPTKYQEYFEKLVGFHTSKLFLIYYGNVYIATYVCHINNDIDCTMGEWSLEAVLAPYILYTHFRTTLVATG